MEVQVGRNTYLGKERICYVAHKVTNSRNMKALSYEIIPDIPWGPNEGVEYLGLESFQSALDRGQERPPSGYRIG